MSYFLIYKNIGVLPSEIKPVYNTNFSTYNFSRFFLPGLHFSGHSRHSRHSSRHSSTKKKIKCKKKNKKASAKMQYIKNIYIFKSKNIYILYLLNKYFISYMNIQL